MGGNKAGSETTPVTWQKTLTPWQVRMSAGLGKRLGKDIQSGGITSQERGTYMGNLMDNLSQFGAVSGDAMRRRFGAQGVTGGVLSEAQAGLQGQKMQEFGKGIRQIDMMGRDIRQQAITNALTFLGMNAPVASESKTGGTIMGFPTKV